MNTITLYHGSSFDFSIIDLKQGRPYKDFGQGFYASAVIGHAKDSNMKELPNRKPNRLRGHDYSQSGLYFITVCTKNREELFGFIKDNQMVLNEYGNIVNQEIEIIPVIRNECVVHEFVVMPNHIHLVVEIKITETQRDDCHRPLRKPTETQRDDCHRPLQRAIANMVQGLKGAITRRIGFSPWQRNYHDHIIRNDKDYIRIAEYIINNPARWRDDRFYKSP